MGSESAAGETESHMRRYKTPEQLKAWRARLWRKIGEDGYDILLESYYDNDGKLMMVYRDLNGNFKIVPWEKKAKDLGLPLDLFRA